MRRNFHLPLLALGAGLLVFIGSSSAEVRIKLEPYVTGLNAPLAMVQPPGDARKFVLEQFGRIRIIDEGGQLQGEPFLDICNKIVTLMSDFDERALRTLAGVNKEITQFIVSATAVYIEAVGSYLWNIG